MEKTRMDKKTKIIVGVLLAAVVVLAGIVVYGYSMGWLVTQQQAAYTIGYQQAIVDVVQNSLNCNAVPLTIGNQTFGLVNVACPCVKDCFQQIASNTTG